MAAIDTRNLQVSIVQNQLVPAEGPKTVPLIIDFSATLSWDCDLALVMQQTRLSMVQSLFVDLSGSDLPLTITINGSGQIIVIKGRTQGYYPVLVPNPAKLNFAMSNVGPSGVRIFLCNSPVAGVQWLSQ